VGRNFDSTRLFLKWDVSFAGGYRSWLISTGHELMISVRAQRMNGAQIKWADIANAQPGSPLYADIVRWADRMSGLGVPVWFTFNHEPEATVNLSNGTNTTYIAAWRRIVDIFRERGVDNVRFMWIMTSYAFTLPQSERRYAQKWWPGDAYVDGIASDTYNWYQCRPGINTAWRSVAQLIDPMRAFGLQHPSVPLYLTEWGSVEDPQSPGRKAQWIADAQALFKTPAFAQFAGVSYYNYTVKGQCVWDVRSSASSLDAFRAMGHDPYYGGSGTR